jgi:hypothetical protein
VQFPIKAPADGQIQALSLWDVPLRAGGGGLAYYGAKPGSDFMLQLGINNVYQCRITNYGSKTLVNITLGLNLVFIDVINDIANKQIISGGIHSQRPWRIDIKKIDPGQNGELSIYIWNLTKFFANVSFPSHAVASYVGLATKYYVPISSSNSSPLTFNPFVGTSK